MVTTHSIIVKAHRINKTYYEILEILRKIKEKLQVMFTVDFTDRGGTTNSEGLREIRAESMHK